MSLKTILREIIRTFTFWIPTSNPPKWVIKASNRWYSKFIRKYGHNPYDKIKYFIGKNYIYKVYYETVAQGQIREKYYWKPRIK